MPHRITLETSSSDFRCGRGQSVLEAMAGCNAGGISVGCRSGGCGVCRVQVLEGRYDAGTMSGEQITAECRERGIALACRLFPTSDLHLRVLGKRVGDGAQVSTAELIRRLTALTAAPDRRTAGAA
ncbi:MAG: hypothetical protein NVS9B10_01150 [Nevskia sp.]